MKTEKPPIKWDGRMWNYQGQWSGTNKSLSLYKQKDGEDYITVNENKQVVFRFQYIKEKTPMLRKGNDVL